MEISPFRERLERNGPRIQALVAGVSADDARWKPNETSWSLLEVMHHLWDEEREDFRQRIDYLVNRPGEEFPPIHPSEWVTSRSYNTKDWNAVVEGFIGERRKSVEWLRTLSVPDWDREYHLPRPQVLRVGDLLTSWLAHDYLHMRQIVRLHFMAGEKLGAPYKTDYAGSW
jgi:DinB family protein